MKISLLVLLLILPIVSQVYADDNIEIFTEKANYNYGDKVKIFGTSSVPSQPFTTHFFNLDKNNGVSGTSFTDNQGNFIFTNPLPLDAGLYEVIINGDISAVTYFTYLEESESALEIQTDKAEYYDNQEIFISTKINGIVELQVEYEFFYPDGVEIQLDKVNNIKLDTNSLDFIVNTNDSMWDGYSGFILVNATVNNSWNTAVFHYTDEPDMTSEIHHEYIMENKDRLNNNDNDRQSIRDELTVLNGYVGGITNPTLDSEFPLILNQNDARKVTAEITRLQEAIAKTDIEINQTMTQLTDALLDNNPSKIEKFTKSVGSYIALNELRKAALNMINIYIEIYS